MDLGVAGRKAIVCASSRGLGLACARALAQAGAAVVMNGRDPDVLDREARALARETGADVAAVTADVSTPDGRAALLRACPDADILVTNNGGPPPMPLAELDREALATAIEMNMMSAIELVQAILPAMKARRFGRIVNITSVAVRMPIQGLAASSAARAGLTGFMAAAARDAAAHGVTINTLQPGFFATERIVDVVQSASRRQGVSQTEGEKAWLDQVPAGRFGRPEEFGAICAFFCSAPAGYITGRSLLVDGGLYPGAF